MDLNIQTLDNELDNFDINNVQSKEFTDDMMDNECIIYSYPYYNCSSFDYEFRVTVTEDNFILDEIRCNDDEIDFEKCVEELKTVCNIKLDTAIEYIHKNIDIRDLTSSLHNEDAFVNFDIQNLNNDEKNKIIQKNKKVVLKELYQEIIIALS